MNKGCSGISADFLNMPRTIEHIVAKCGNYAGRCANKALQMTQTAFGNFGIFLSHNGLAPICGSLPVVRARFGQLSAGVMLPGK
jgi:hypothetical protein